MRLTVLIALRTFSITLILIALLVAAKLAMGTHAIFLVQQAFPDVSLLKLGRLHGEFIFAPFLLAAFFTAAGVVAWRVSRRFAGPPSV
jgi:hypothetical protein